MAGLQGMVACPRILYGGQKFDRNQFFIWAAIHRNMSRQMSPGAKLSCPLVPCRMRFESHEMMLQHLYTCTRLSQRGYWCEDCRRVEYIDQQDQPPSHNRRRRIARKFGNTCSKMVMAASNKLHRQRGLNTGSLCDPDYAGPGLRELDATEIYEMGGCEEVQGLLTGVQYLDTMSTALDQDEVPPYTATCGHGESVRFDNTLDFLRPETFHFLRAAALEDELHFNSQDSVMRDPTDALSFAGPVEMPGCQSFCLEGNHEVGCSHGWDTTMPRRRETVEKPSLNSYEMDWISLMVDAFQTHKALASYESDSSLGVPASQQAKRTNNTHKAQTPVKPRKSQKDGPQIAQWVTLWRLRYDLRALYDKLVKTAETATSPRARRVGRLYKDATHMLQVGLSTFEAVLEGIAPSNLQKVLAFVCISKVMWNTVRRKKHGIGISAHDPLENLGTWRLAVRDVQDRAVLDLVANSLWNVPLPESPSVPQSKTATCTSEHTDMNSMLLDIPTFDSAFFDAKEPTAPDIPFENLQCRLGGIDDTHLLFDPFAAPPDAENLAQYFHNEVDLLLAETSAHDEIRFSDFLNIPGAQMSSSAADGSGALVAGLPGTLGTSTRWDAASTPLSASLGSLNSIHAWDNFDPTNATISPMELSMPSARGWDPPDKASTSSWLRPLAPGTSDRGKAGQDDEKGLIKMLIGTLMFQVVVTFLRSLVDRGPLLRILTGCGKAHPPGAFATPVKPKPVLDPELLQELMRKAVDPLRSTFAREHKQMLGILSMAESMIRSGVVSSLRDFEDYVLHVGVHFARSKESFMSLVRSVLRQCFKCSRNMTWNHVYGDDASEVEEYSDEYVASRELDETHMADTMFADSAVVNPSMGSASPGSSLGQEIGDSTSDTQSGSPHSSPVSVLSTETSLSQRIEACIHKGCDKVFKGRDAAVNLRRHVRCTHEASGKERECPGSGCNIKTARRDNLRRHFLKQHPNERMPDWLRDRKRS